MKRYLLFGFALWCLWQPLYASVEEYRQIDRELNAPFEEKLRHAIAKRIESASNEVRALYCQIDYHPVWVKYDALSANAMMLLGEIGDDLSHGALKSLKPAYEKMLKERESLSSQTPLERKVRIEFAMMQLYIDHINAIVAGTDSEHTPQSLLKAAVDNRSLLYAYNAVARERIEKRIPSAETNATMIDTETTEALRKGSDKARERALYRALGYRPVWVNETGLSAFAETLFKQIENDPIFDHDGPTYKRFQALKSAPLPKNKAQKLDWEFEINALYRDYMGYLLYGAIDWKRFSNALKKRYKHGVWDVHEVLLSPELLLVEAVKAGSLDHAFKKATPRFPAYKRLVAALLKYKHIAESGGWEKLPDFKDLKPGMQSNVVPLLRERLRIEGDYVSCEGVDGNSTLYDACLLDAVKRFQTRHGLNAEGYVGKKTRKALSETARHKYVRLRLSIARLKWLKRDTDRYHIVVNIPDYTVTVFDGWRVMEKMRVVVGRSGHETPVFYNRVSRIVLNPYWRIPASIVRNETIPKLKRDPGYTKKRKIEIHTGYSEHSPEINPYKVNWHKYGKRLPPYKFMQSPGEHNALGKVKFLFPNRYAVYMHDTPEKALFSRDIRAFSHGCVRLHRPYDMLEVFGKIDPKVDYDKAQEILKTNKKHPISLSRTVPIDIIYISAWADENGTVQFREDIYGYDALHIETAKWLPSSEG